MKTTITLLTLILILSFNTVFTKPGLKSKVSKNTVESLMIGLKSENLGLKSSSVYMIGELQLSNAVIPMMKILRESENVELRISAALALFKIGSPASIHAVKQAIRFDKSERVSKHCANFYYDFMKSKIRDEN